MCTVRNLLLHASDLRRYQVGICHLRPIRRESMTRAAFHVFRVPFSRRQFFLGQFAVHQQLPPQSRTRMRASSSEPSPVFFLQGLKRRLR